LLIGGVAAGAAALGGLVWGAEEGVLPLPGPIARRLADKGPDGVVPPVPPGRQTVTVRHSAARGRDVSFYTAVPDGYGDGHGLPVCLVLHGASATADSYVGFGFGQFLTDAARRNGRPFVLAGATGRPDGWAPPAGPDDPLAMVHEEIPRWCAELGFDTSRLAAWGWSLGGRGSLLLAEEFPGFVRAVAAFSPAIQVGDDVFAGVGALGGTPIGLWCGRSDGYYGAVRELRGELPRPPAVAAFDKGAHTRGYWNRVTPAAFDFIAANLAPAGP
jgi:pimeloyl-ACP methyl ester carboxylesterase